MRLYLFLSLIVFLLMECNKKEETIPASSSTQNSNNSSGTNNLSNPNVDSVNYYEIRQYSMDVTGDSIDDIQFNLDKRISPGGQNDLTIDFLIKNGRLRAHTILKNDTICKYIDTTNGFDVYYVKNCSNSSNYFEIDSTAFCPAIDEINLFSTLFYFNGIGNLIYKEVLFSPPGPVPGIIYYNTRHGAFLDKSEGFLVFKDIISNKITAVKISIKTPGYFKVWKTIKALN